MLRHVLGVVQQLPELAGVLVVSRDTKVLSIAREYGARTLQETGAQELNAALTRATQFIGRFSAGVLVLPADLPLIQLDDIQSLLRLGQREPSLVLATDQHEDGTNALLMRPPGLIDFAYGPGSFQRHVGLARAVNVEPIVFHSERLSVDIDVPDDLRFVDLLPDTLHLTTPG
jgi:2-phospho-L-lactate guanylyltransferase